jgi:hypothetical protein
MRSSQTSASFVSFGVILVLCGAPAAVFGQDSVVTVPGLRTSDVVFRAPGRTICAGSIIYDTTHASTQGAEIAAAANGPATSMGDLIVLAGTDRFLCEVVVDLFTLTATTPFDLTMSLYTDCTTDGSAGSACGNGPGALIAGSAVTVTGITPPGLGTIFSVAFSYPLLDLTAEADNTITVSLNPSRSDVFWRIDETPAVGALPAGEPGTSFVQRCGSTDHEQRLPA